MSSPPRRTPDDLGGTPDSASNAQVTAPPSATVSGVNQLKPQGNLREQLIAAALRLVQEEGVDGISVREVARRAGVSSGAPFRHFRDRNELLLAIAEDGLRQLEAATDAAVANAPPDPLSRLQAVGITVATFAARHPAHFRVMHAPGLGTTDAMRALLDAKRRRMRALIEDGQREGLIREGDPEELIFACVALVYGLARFFVDGLTGFPLDTGVAERESIEGLARSITRVLGHGLATEKYWATCPAALGLPDGPR